MTMAWFSSGTQPFDYNRFTPEAVLRAAQSALGVTADGKYGPRTNAAFQTYLNRALASDPQSAQAPAFRQALAETQGLRAGQTLGGAAWGMLAAIGLGAMDSARFQSMGLSVTAGAPTYSAGTTAAAPAPARTPAATPARTAAPGSSSSNTSSLSPASAANSLADFFKRNKTPILVIGGVASVAAIGLIAYAAMGSDDEDEDREMPRRPQLPPPRPSDREAVAPRPRQEYGGPGRQDELAARMLGIRPDADASSIRAAYAREAGKYPRSDADSGMRREQLKRARDFMLRNRGVR